MCAFAGLEFEAGMLDYVGRSDSARKPHQQRLNQPPTAGVRDWRTELDPADEAAFEEVAGGLLAALGYETREHPAPRREPGSSSGPTARRRRAWRGVGYVMQRSPLWRRRHPPLS